MDAKVQNARRLPSVDAVLRTAAAGTAIERFGRPAVLGAVRDALADARATGAGGAADDIAVAARTKLEAQAVSSLRPVFNLTGTVLHTNLGRALVAEAAIEAATAAMRHAVALEFELASGKRGERDDHLRALLRE